MNVEIFNSPRSLAAAASSDAARLLREAIEQRGKAFVVAATGASQFEFLEALSHDPTVDWSKVTFFHLDEYVGLPDSHAASFRRYLKERIEERVQPAAFHFIEGDSNDVVAECRRLSDLILQQSIDVAFVGVGENGHLAFNDPPADFQTMEPYIVVELDEACRRQQVGEGWFAQLDEVPRQAISMSIQQILKSQHILCIVPDERKAVAVRNCLESAVSPMLPASILQLHPATTIYLDSASASLLSTTRAATPLSQ